MVRTLSSTSLSSPVKRRLKREGVEFPIVQQAAYSDWRAATFPPDVPLVVKVGTASGGLGKMKINTQEEWSDFCSVMAMQVRFTPGMLFH